MAIALYHFHVGQIRRSAGSSAVAAAAYRAGEKLHSERYDEINDYTRKGGVLFNDILLPPHAPPEYADRETLWNAVEKVEKRADAQLAYSFDIALQSEFSTEENMELAKKFLMDNFVSRGMIVDYAVHDPDRDDGGIKNPHFHVMCPIRPVNEDGSWGNKQKKIPILDANGNKIRDEQHGGWKMTAVPTTDWGSPETLETWRKNWCDLCNEKFEEKGLDVRLDWRSYERQGIDQLAQVHEGPAVRAMEKKGIPTEKGEYNRWVKATNALIKSFRRTISGMLKWIGSLDEKIAQRAQKDMAGQESPNLIQMLLSYQDLQRAGAENFSAGGRKKANLITFKDVTSAIAYLRDNNISTLDQLEKKINSFSDEVDRTGDSMKEKTARIKVLKEAISQAPVYRENLPVFREMGASKYKFRTARDKYKTEHESELKLFYRARRILKEAGMPDEFDPKTVDAWRKELVSLQGEYESEYAKLKPEREELKKLDHIQYCVNRVLKEKDQPEQSQDQKRKQNIEI